MQAILDALDRALAEGRSRVPALPRRDRADQPGCRVLDREPAAAAARPRSSGSTGPGAGNRRSRNWPTIPETEEQADFVRRWGCHLRPPWSLRRPRRAAVPAGSRPARPGAGHAARARRRRRARPRGARTAGRRLVGQDRDGALPGGQPDRERRARRRGPGRALLRLATQRTLVEHRQLRRHQCRDRARARHRAMDRKPLRGLARPRARRCRAARAHRPGRRLVQRDRRSRPSRRPSTARASRTRRR